MKKIAACLIALTSALFADTGLFEKENDLIRCCNFTPAPYPGDPLCNGCPMYPAYAGVGVHCGWNIYAVGEFLYWQPHRQMVIIASENVVAPSNPQIELVEDFGYRPAFRVGLGLVMPNFANWILNADYTWYHHGFTTTMSATAPNTLTDRVGTTLTSAYRTIQARSHFNYNYVNGNVQTTFYLGKQVVLNPYFGLKWRGRTLTFSEDLLRTTGLTDTRSGNQKKQGIGPDLGANLNWLWGWGFSLATKAEFALLYNYKASYSQTVNAISPVSVSTQTASTNAIDMFAKGGIGLGWGQYFSRDRFHVNFSATYDVVAEFTTLFLPNDSGMLQGQFNWFEGLTLTGQFDF